MVGGASQKVTMVQSSLLPRTTQPIMLDEDEELTDGELRPAEEVEEEEEEEEEE